MQVTKSTQAPAAPSQQATSPAKAASPHKSASAQKSAPTQKSASFSETIAAASTAGSVQKPVALQVKTAQPTPAIPVPAEVQKSELTPSSVAMQQAAVQSAMNMPPMAPIPLTQSMLPTQLPAQTQPLPAPMQPAAQLQPTAPMQSASGLLSTGPTPAAPQMATAAQQMQPLPLQAFNPANSLQSSQQLSAQPMLNGAKPPVIAQPMMQQQMSQLFAPQASTPYAQSTRAGIASPAGMQSGSSLGVPAEESWQVISSDLESQQLGVGTALAQKTAPQWSSEDYVSTLNSAKKPLPGKTLPIGGFPQNGQAPNPDVIAQPAQKFSPGAINPNIPPSGLGVMMTNPVEKNLPSQKKSFGPGVLESGSAQTTAQAVAAGLLAKQAGGVGTQPGGVQLNAQVVQGAMAKPRLASESVLGMSQQIRTFSEQNGGGEIRVKLKPENLGELNLRVITRGGQVGLEIRASDENAKRVIEESVQALREGLSSQNLTLSRFDISVGQPSAASADAGSNFLNQQSDLMQSQLNQNQGQRQDQDSRDSALSGGSMRDAERTRGMAAQAPLTSRYTRPASGDGRLNVLA